MIIGYYEQAYFSGGTYIKLTKKENEYYKIEFLHSEVPNYVPNADEFIKRYETLCIEDDMFREELQNGLIVKKIEEQSVIEKLISYIGKINLEKLSKKEYDDEVDDGLSWECFIKIDEKAYHIEGYENQPKEIKKIKEFLEQLYK